MHPTVAFSDPLAFDGASKWIYISTTTTVSHELSIEAWSATEFLVRLSLYSQLVASYGVCMNPLIGAYLLSQ